MAARQHGRLRQRRDRIFQRRSQRPVALVNRWDVGARAGFDRRIARRTTFSAGANVGYSPYYGFGNIGQGIFNGGGNSSNSGPRLHRRQTTDVELRRTRRGLSSPLGPFVARGLLHASVTCRSWGARTDGFGDQRTQTVGARYRYAINRYVSARAGYGYMRSIYGGIDSRAGHQPSHRCRSGWRLRPRVHIARRTTFSFDTRSSIFVADQVSTDNTFHPTTQFFLGGSVALAHRWARTGGPTPATTVQPGSLMAFVTPCSRTRRAHRFEVSRRPGSISPPPCRMPSATLDSAALTTASRRRPVPRSSGTAPVSQPCSLRPVFLLPLQLRRRRSRAWHGSAHARQAGRVGRPDALAAALLTRAR